MVKFKFLRFFPLSVIIRKRADRIGVHPILEKARFVMLSVAKHLSCPSGDPSVAEKRSFRVTVPIEASKRIVRPLSADYIFSAFASICTKLTLVELLPDYLSPSPFPIFLTMILPAILPFQPILVTPISGGYHGNSQRTDILQANPKCCVARPRRCDERAGA